jgi:serine protease AprX
VRRSPLCLSTSWGSGRPTNPTPEAPTSTRWGSGRGRDRRALAVVGLGLLALSALTAVAVPTPAGGIGAGARGTGRTGVALDAAADSPDLTGLPGMSAAAALGSGALAAQGAGQTVAVLDSGVDPVPALAGRLMQGIDLTGEGLDDRYGHGTFVAGLIAGDGATEDGSDNGAEGVAPLARIVSVKVVRDDGSSDARTLAEGLQWVLTHQAAYGITVVNLSLSVTQVESSAADSPVDGLAEALWHDGVVVVASAGNDGGTVDRAPADDPTILTVGADYAAGAAPGREVKAPFSDAGITGDGVAKPEVSAPGVHLQAPLPQGSVLAGRQATTGQPAGYGQLSGTSMSAAVASGAAADLLAARPFLSPAQVKAALVRSAGGPADSVRLAAALALHLGYTPDPRPIALIALLLGLSGTPATAPTEAGWALTGGSDRAGQSSATWDSATWDSATWDSATWDSATWDSATWDSAVWDSSVSDLD